MSTIARTNTARHTVMKYPTAGAALYRIEEIIDTVERRDPQEQVTIIYKDVCDIKCTRDMWPLGDVAYVGPLETISYYMLDATVVATWLGYGPEEEGHWQFNLASPALDKLPTQEKLAETGGASDALTIERVNALCAGFLLVTAELV